MMPLSAFVAERRRAIFDGLLAGNAPVEGSFDEAVFAAGRAKGLPQLGTTRFKPDAVLLEFIYPADAAAPTILTVTIPVPERVVFLPVPSWVVESIWQGEIDGSYHFESDARRLVEEYAELLSEQSNAERFESNQPKRRA